MTAQKDGSVSKVASALPRAESGGWPSGHGEGPTGQPLHTTPALRFTAYGRPTPQGSKHGIVNRYTGKVAMVESSAARLRPWRATISEAARAAMAVDGWERLTGPVSICVVLLFDRPRSHYGTGRNASVLRANAPAYPATRRSGDVEKHLRAVYDACTDAGVWVDDSQVVHEAASKMWTCPSRPVPAAVVLIWPTP